MKLCTVLLVDDHVVLRRGVALMLQGAAGVKVIGEAGSGDEAVQLVQKLKPAVVLLDVNLPDIDGIAVTQKIHDLGLPTRVLGFSAYADRRHVLQMMRAGAAGYLVKDCVLDDLLEAIATVAAGKRYLSPNISTMLLSSLAEEDGHQALSSLTSREAEVLQLLADGKAMKQAAIELQISTKTVETHRRAIMEKLQLFSVAELTKHAIREGLTTLD